MAKPLRVKELLEKIKAGAKRKDIQLGDVEEALSDETFLTADGLLTADDNEDTLLHLAAKTKGLVVLPLVSEEYKRLKVFPDAMVKLNKANRSPLHIAIVASLYDNVTHLFKDCLDLCPKAVEPLENGWSLIHSATQHHKNGNIVKYFLSQDICKPMLMSAWKKDTPPYGSFLPLDIVQDELRASEVSFRFAEKFFEDNAARHPYINSFVKSSAYSQQVGTKKKCVEGFRELRSLIEPPTMELKAEEAKRLAKERTEQKRLAVAKKTRAELQELLQSSNWEIVISKYLLSEQEQIQKVTVRFLGERHTVDALSDTQLPQLPDNALKLLVNFLALTDNDPTVKGALRLLKELTHSKQDNHPMLDHEELQLNNKVLHLLLSLDAEIQQLSAAILLNRFNILQRPESFKSPAEDSEMIQSLLLVKWFSQDEEARSLVSEALQSLGVKGKQPDPGSWTVSQVSFWMENKLELDRKSEFSKNFKEANIDGLHLLELTSSEMSGLGIKFVSHQRKLASLIDELRRMNMRSIVGHKDVFLSYAHININFARRIKGLLNDNDYTVWIDEAGIRAGQKWRNEIADGIQGCSVFLFIMTPRSANSEYCQDEIALAEEYHKPIMTVRLEAVSEMDPGLKLIIQRRQWMDFMNESLFELNKVKLIEAITSTVGPGSGPELEMDETMDGQEHSVADNPDHSSELHDGEADHLQTVRGEAITKEYLEREVEKIRENFRIEIQQLRTMVKELSERLDCVEQTKS